MQVEKIVTLLEQVKRDEVSIEAALAQLRDLPFTDLPFARLDHHRELRTGIPEIVFGEGKTTEQIRAIVRRLTERESLVLVSRVTEEQGICLQEEFTEGKFHRDARIFSLSNSKHPRATGRGKVMILAAGTSDLPVAEEAAVTVALLGNDVEKIYDVGVAGLHRLLAEVPRIREATVLIVVAGLEGALPSVVAGLVGRPIIAVPTSVGYGTSMKGLAALLAMLNGCAPGVTVVNIDNGIGAAVAAHLMNRV